MPKSFEYALLAHYCPSLQWVLVGWGSCRSRCGFVPFWGGVGRNVSRGWRSSRFRAYVNELYDQTLTWEDVRWLKSVTSLPVVVKGILTGLLGPLPTCQPAHSGP